MVGRKVRPDRLVLWHEPSPGLRVRQLGPGENHADPNQLDHLGCLEHKDGGTDFLLIVQERSIQDPPQYLRRAWLFVL